MFQRWPCQGAKIASRFRDIKITACPKPILKQDNIRAQTIAVTITQSQIFIEGAINGWLILEQNQLSLQVSNPSPQLSNQGTIIGRTISQGWWENQCQQDHGKKIFFHIIIFN